MEKGKDRTPEGSVQFAGDGMMDRDMMLFLYGQDAAVTSATEIMSYQ